MYRGICPHTRLAHTNHSQIEPKNHKSSPCCACTFCCSSSHGIVSQSSEYMSLIACFSSSENHIESRVCAVIQSDWICFLYGSIAFLTFD